MTAPSRDDDRRISVVARFTVSADESRSRIAAASLIFESGCRSSCETKASASFRRPWTAWAFS